MFKIVSVKKGKEIKAQGRTVRRSKVCVSRQGMAHCGQQAGLIQHLEKILIGE